MIGARAPGVLLGYLTAAYLGASWLREKKLKTYTYGPRAACGYIALNYSVKNIRNDVQQAIHINIHMYMKKFKFNSLVRGSLMLATMS